MLNYMHRAHMFSDKLRQYLMIVA